jgi:hypothetical protein
MLKKRRIQIHLRLRWLGVPLFFAAVAELCFATYGVANDFHSWHVALWAFGAMATSLATFGNHTENAIAYMQELKGGDLSPSMRSELNWELKRNRSATLSLSATPVTSIIITLLALTMHTLTINALLGA